MAFEQIKRQKMLAFVEGIEWTIAKTKELPDEAYFDKAASLKRKKDIKKIFQWE